MEDEDFVVIVFKFLGLLGFMELSLFENELVFLYLDGKKSGFEVFLDLFIGCVQEELKEGFFVYGWFFFVVVLGYGDVKGESSSVLSLREEVELLLVFVVLWLC